MEVWQIKCTIIVIPKGYVQEIKVTFTKKQCMLDIIDSLDVKAKSIPLNAPEREEMSEANEKFANLC
jgi:hypothetical protein